jgi:hypothetical protein
MASTRKLQGEIDRVLKQIAEHMQEFDQIWSARSMNSRNASARPVGVPFTDAA